jgi:hypothetical protein
MSARGEGDDVSMTEIVTERADRLAGIIAHHETISEGQGYRRREDLGRRRFQLEIGHH